MRSRHRKRTLRAKRIGVFLAIVVLVIVAAVLIKIESCGIDSTDSYISYAESEVSEVKVELVTTASTSTPNPVLFAYDDPDNYIFPYNTMSADWGVEIYEDGFRFYEIPEEYKREGVCFPEVVQVYLWSLCKERGIDYCTVVALIERESGYKYDASGDNGNSKGYMQIYEKWHRDRMEAESVADLYNPYGNIRVGLNYLQSLSERYLESSGMSCVLMAYNMGESTAKRFWADGVYSSAYSREILARADEIRKEIE